MKHLLLALFTFALTGSVFGQGVVPNWKQKRQVLTQDINGVALPGSVGSLCVFGENAFPVVTAAFENQSRLPIIACAEVEDGRVVACAHGGYVEQDHAGTDTERLMLRLARWATKKQTGKIRFGVRKQRGFSKTLLRDGHKRIDLKDPDWVETLKEIDLLVLAGGDMTAQSIGALGKFVSRGGGLIIADAAWVWNGYRKQPGERSFHDYPENQFLAKHGIVLTRAIVRRDAASGTMVQASIPAEVHALHSVELIDSGLLKSDQQQNQARVSIEQGLESIPLDDQQLIPQLKLLSAGIGIEDLRADLSQRRGLTELKKRLCVGYQTINAIRQNVTTANASPLADHFPGNVDRNIDRVSATLKIDTARPRWHSTGLYAAPGEVINVTVGSESIGQGLRARIGCHKDRLWHKPAWQRAPEITRTFSTDTESTTIANAFGGLIYVEVPPNCDLGKIDVTIGQAVPAPMYVHGDTDRDEWKLQRRKRGPWAEIGSDKIIFTVPSSSIRDLDRPDLVMEYWDEVMDACADLATIDPTRQSPERFVIDVQISAGYMHAGYPIMAPRNLASEVLDVPTLRAKGNWGVFHEIGHNHQQPDWTYNGMGEVTVNLFSMFVYDTLHHGVKQHGQVQPDSIKQKIADFERTGRRDGPWVNLIPYIQLRREFGWKSFQNVFREYRELPDAKRPKTDLDKRSQWMVRFSKEVNRNLAPFFEYWKIEVSDQTKQEVSDLPPWSHRS